jgi:hypothetical protein
MMIRKDWREGKLHTAACGNVMSGVFAHLTGLKPVKLT